MNIARNRLSGLYCKCLFSYQTPRAFFKVNLKVPTFKFCTLARRISGNVTVPENHLKRLCSVVGSSDKNEMPDFDEIADGNSEVVHQLKVIALEMSVMRQEGKCVPIESELSEAQWKELLKLPSRSSRMRYLEFLFKIQKKKENRKIKKEQKRLERESRLLEKPKAKTFEEFVSTYDLSHNNIFLRFYDTTINQFYNNRLIQAIQFGQKIVVDCGFENDMTPREIKNCAKQLMFLFAENRDHDNPYDVHFCNINKEGLLMQTLHKYIVTMYEPWFPLNLHESSYLNIFPKEKLIYLTPHCKEELTEYDHDAVYIIGGIVDKINNKPLTLAKAKKERLKMAKFPLDRYLHWGAGSGKNLTLNQSLSILLDVKHTGDWEFALRHVPRRKLEENAFEKLSPQVKGRKQNSKFKPLIKLKHIF